MMWLVAEAAVWIGLIGLGLGLMFGPQGSRRWTRHAGVFCIVTGGLCLLEPINGYSAFWPEAWGWAAFCGILGAVGVEVFRRELRA